MGLKPVKVSIVQLNRGGTHTPTAASFIPAIMNDKKANPSLGIFPLG
jgi:hypothetical protein